MLPQELLGASYSRDDVYDAAADIYTGVSSVHLTVVHFFFVLSLKLPSTRDAFRTPPEAWLTGRVIVHVLVRVDFAGSHCVVYDLVPRVSANVKLTSL
jgi:hypothetical protein